MTTSLRAVVLAALYAAFTLMPLAAVTAAVPSLLMISGMDHLGSGGLYLLSWLALAVLGGYATRRVLDLPAIYGWICGTALWVWLAPVTVETQRVFAAYLLGGLEGGVLYQCFPRRTRWLIAILGGAFCLFAGTIAGAGAWALILAPLVTSVLVLVGPASTSLRGWIERWEN